MFAEIGCAAASVILMLVCLIVQPTRASCPPGWYVDGARPSGEYDCRRVPTGDDERLPSGIVVDHTTQPPGVLDGRIFCPNGSPRVLNASTVACSTERR
jgi:hypothetical protein